MKGIPFTGIEQDTLKDLSSALDGLSELGIKFSLTLSFHQNSDENSNEFILQNYTNIDSHARHTALLIALTKRFIDQLDKEQGERLN